MIIRECLFGLYYTNVYWGLVLPLVANFLKWSANDPDIGSIISGDSNQSRYIFQIAINKPIRAVDRINPYANFFIRYLKPGELSLLWHKIKCQFLIVNGDFPFVVDLLFTNDQEFREELS